MLLLFPKPPLHLETNATLTPSTTVHAAGGCIGSLLGLAAAVLFGKHTNASIADAMAWIRGPACENRRRAAVMVARRYGLLVNTLLQ